MFSIDLKYFLNVVVGLYRMYFGTFWCTGCSTYYQKQSQIAQNNSQQYFNHRSYKSSLKWAYKSSDELKIDVNKLALICKSETIVDNQALLQMDVVDSLQILVKMNLLKSPIFIILMDNIDHISTREEVLDIRTKLIQDYFIV